jgi:excinuclease ABC subunit A
MIKLASELQRIARGDTLYVLDEPTTGLHAADVERLVVQLDKLVDAGKTVLVVEHDMRVVGASDWVIDIGPGAGDEDGRVIAVGAPSEVAKRLAAARRLIYSAYLPMCPVELPIGAPNQIETPVLGVLRRCRWPSPS